MENSTQSAARATANAFSALARTARRFKSAREQYEEANAWLKRNLGASDARGTHANLLEIQKRASALVLAADCMAGELAHAETLGTLAGLPRLKSFLGIAMRGEDPYDVWRMVVAALAK